MGTTQRQVEDACANIRGSLDAFRAKPDRLPDLQRCLAGLRWLREQYLADKELLAPYMDRIKDLSRDVHEALAAAKESLTAQYLQASSAVAAWQEIREACRGALVELAEAGNLERLESPQGHVQVKRARVITVPRIDSPRRQQLYAILTEAQCWAEVAVPNPARLLKAVDGGMFTPQQTDEITRLCPVRTICRLTCHANA